LVFSARHDLVFHTVGGYRLVGGVSGCGLVVG
jgi:hypothetical protein